MFIRPWLEALKSRWVPGNRLNKRRAADRMPVQYQVESLEDKSLLSAFDLITVIPNQGVFLSDGAVLHEAPKEVTLRFSPGETITQASLGSISIVRAGVDGVFDDPTTPAVESTDDVTLDLTKGFVGLGDQPNEVIVRFAQTLPDDKYQIRIDGTGANSIQAVSGDAFNGGADKTFHFELDLGAQVESIVPQPIIRSAVFSSTGSSSLTDGDIVTITAGANTYNFEINLPSSPPTAAGNIPVNVAAGSTANQIADSLVAAINTNTGGNLTASDSGTNTITVTGAAFEPVVAFTSTKFDAFSKTQLTVANTANLSDGDLIKVTFNNIVYTFELNKSPSNAVGIGNIRVDFTGSDSPATIATNLAAKINALSINNPIQVLKATAIGSSIALTSSPALGTPALSITTALANGLTQVVGTLKQQSDKVVVYFNQDQLDPTTANDPKFYRLVDTVTGFILLPSSVNYTWNNTTGLSVAVLSFVAALPNSTYNLKIGVSSEPDSSIATAVQAGSIFSNQDFTTSNYLGDESVGGVPSSTNAADNDLFQFNLTAAGTVTLTLSSSATLDGVITLLNSAGTPISAPINATGLGGSETFTSGALPVGTYYAKVTSNGGTGGYNLRIHTDLIISASDDNSSYTTATDLGGLGTSGLSVNAQIEPQGAFVTMPQLPGGSDEPGHRDLPSGAFIGSSAPEVDHSTGTDGNPTPPNAILVQTYSFPLTYDASAAGLGTLQNEITDSQKEIIREIFAIYSNEAGIQFREVASGGDEQIVLGDVRANAPQLAAGAAGGISGSPLIINSIFYKNDNTFGGGFTTTAFHEIGHNLGLGHSYDVPSIQGGGVDSENVFTGDNDLIHLLRLLPNNASDIDLYKFNVTQNGTLSAQTIAERLNAADQLDTALTLYRVDATGNRIVVARNDDFYSKDSGINLAVTPGTYYIGVTSSGNNNYDPSISNSGFGGKSDGAYQLKLDFKPTAAASSGLTDTTGQFLDGNQDGIAGGEYNSWFTVAPTIVVDKLAPAGGTGTVAAPFKTISAGLAAALPGSIVRIVGNGGADGDNTTLGDNVPYLIGKDYNIQQTPLADGVTFQVPKGVTVMIDAGALIKLHAQTVDVGSSSSGIDRSHGALQVLGTPVSNVTFTSFRDDANGSIDDGTNGAAATADWGGIVFRKDSDTISATDATTGGVFLNSVNHATLQYGGGQVSVDGSQPVVYNAIDMETSRPTITNNIIRNNADSAISANPDSFRSDDGRIGPDVHGNLLSQNSTNGLFIRVQTPLGGQFESLNVIAEFAATDITYALTQSLIINGDAGSALGSAGPARLLIDPGVIVKLSGARIETGIGSSNLIAEGTAANPIHFTSQQDDSYGAGGTFDLKNDLNLPSNAPKAGNWSGIYVGQTSTASLDHVTVTYAGGLSEIAGNNDNFNPIEVYQGNLRLTNSFFENNLGGAASSSRGGRGGNDSSTVFVRGAQPVIVDNTFQDNQGNVISINANSLQGVVMPDYGRSTGAVSNFGQFDDNYGPLVRLNKIANSSTFNLASTLGMNIRPEELTIESIWDDTDITHVVRGTISSSEFHTYGGLTLQSSSTGSLVVKLQGANAGFVATGDPLEIANRIGGTVDVIGQPNFPVVLTSLKDDTVGAGFKPNGFPQFDTNGDNNAGGASVGTPGDWKSLLFDQYSNDTNVALVNETEPGLTQGNDINNTIASPQALGNLAPNLNSGDENRRLGYEVHGFISPDSPGDVDVYSFNAAPGTEVWIDTGFTSQRLDAMVELLDSSGKVLGRSLNSQSESAGLTSLAGSLYQTVDGNPGGPGNSDLNTLIKDPTLGNDFYTSNFHDAGFRAVLPGTGTNPITYFVRVRSQPVVGQEAAAIPVGGNGLTSGAYQLQIRLQQVYAIPGSTVRYADIRFATNGIETHGLPAHSPLMGESAEGGGDNNSLGGAQSIGPFLQTDRNTLSVAGSLNTSTDVDFYTFTVDYSQVQVISGGSDGQKFFPTMFDINWADGLTRPDTSIAVYNGSGQLMYIGRASDIADDQKRPGFGQDLTDLSRGSVGTKDPSIGTVNLPAGVSGVSETGGINTNPPPAGLTTYYVAVFSNGVMPSALTAVFDSAASPENQRVRLEPVDSIQRIVEDHIGYTGYKSQGVVVAPTDGALVSTASTIALQTNVRPFTLSDVNLFVTSQGALRVVDPYNGTTEISYNNYPVTNVQDINMRTDGTLWAVRWNGQTNNGQLVQVDTGTGGDISAVGDGISDVDGSGTTSQFQTNNAQSDALAWHEANPGNYDFLYYATADQDDYIGGNGVSKLYKANNAGSAAWVGGQFGASGDITDAGGKITTLTTGMQFLGGTLWGVDRGGQLFKISQQAPIGNDGGSNIGNPDPVNNPNTAAAIIPGPKLVATASIVDYAALLNPGEGFAGITSAPQNVENSRYANFLFVITTQGRVLCIDPTAASAAASVQPVFDLNKDGIVNASDVDANGQPILSTALGTATGIAFSPVDYNLWHPTALRQGDQGHGVATTTGTVANPSDDNSRSPNLETQTVSSPLESLTNSQSAGGESLYFGVETYNPGVGGNYLQYQSGGQFGVLQSASQQSLTSNPNIRNNYNVPGGTSGSLVTNAFSLEGYSQGDRPTLYFSYFLDTEQASGRTANSMFDSARVYVSPDNGLTWQLLATNNLTLSQPGTSNAELPEYLSTDRNASLRSNQQVQALYNTSGTEWRQARVDLNDYAGGSQLKLRFDFSTSGNTGTVIDPLTGRKIASDDKSNPTFSPDTGSTNGANGTSNAQRSAQNNNHEGFYVDDIIVGFAGRGEMVTNAGSNGSGFQNLEGNPFAQLTKNPDPAATPQLLTGDYQLEIRRGEQFATMVNPIKSDVLITTPLNVNDRLTDGQTIMVGNTLQSGDTVTVYDGVITKTFEFTNVAPSGTNIPVPINASQGANAANLAAAITAAFTGRKTVVAEAVAPLQNSDRIDIFDAVSVTTNVVSAGSREVENNDTLSTATSTGITAATTGVTSVTGRIGNGVNGNKDVDLWSLQLAAGQTVAFDTDIPSGIGDSIIEIFDSLGNKLASNDDGAGPPPEFTSLESFLLFVAPAAGSYYVGVSGYSNFNYNPTISGSGSVGQTFNYSLNMTVSNPETESSAGGYGNDYPYSSAFFGTQISNMIPGFSSGTDGAYGISGTIGNSQQGNADSDFYQVDLTAGQTLNVSLVSPGFFLPPNYTLVVMQDGNVVPTSQATNGTLTFTAPATGIYHLGVFGDDGSAATPFLNPAFAAPGDPLASSGNDTFDYFLSATISTGAFVAPKPLSVDSYVRTGDDNLQRTQGQLIFEDNQILNVAQSGILVDDNDRFGILPHPGAPLNTPVSNTQGLVTGMYLQNNTIGRFGTNGVEIDGDPNGQLGRAIVPFVKIVNNTIYGGDTQNPNNSTVGILIGHNAGPTIINNAIVNTGTSISLNPASASNTEVEANLFQGNGSDPVVGNNSLVNAAASSAALFVNAPKNNFYPAVGSPLVDSSRSTFNDRQTYTDVTGPLGIPPSPILAPLTDRFGQLRVDDAQPGPANQPGLGPNPFQDRGSIERADSTGGTVIPSAPQDNDGNGVDLDPTTNTIWIDAANPAAPFDIVTSFKLQLVDAGIGIDDSSVNGSDFLLLQNGVPLVQGQDYFFTYNQNTNEAIFTSVSTFSLDSRYQIVIDNPAVVDPTNPNRGITDLAGNFLQNNSAAPITPANPNIPAAFATSQLYFTYVITNGKNDPPVTSLKGTTLPAAPATATPVTINEDGSLIFNASGIGRITVTDPDAFLAPDGDPNTGIPGGRIRVTISIPANVGTLALDPAATTNLLADGGSVLSTGSPVNQLVLDGRIDDINTALNGMTFTPLPDTPIGNPAETVNITVLTEDLGKFGPPSPGTTDPQSTTSIIPVIINPVNDAPLFTVSTPSPITILEDTVGPTLINLTNINAGGGESQSLRITAVSSNPVLIPNANITVDYPNALLPAAQPTTGDIQFTAVANRFGTAVLTITLTDAGLDGIFGNADDLSVVHNVTVNVTGVNDPPEIAPASDTTVLEDVVTQTIVLTGISAGPFEAPGQTLTLTATSSDPTIIPNPTITYVQGDTTAQLTYKPSPNANGGPVTITITAKDDGGTANGGVDTTVTSFTITVVPVNDPPTVNVPATLTINEDSPSNPQTVLLTGISAGPLEAAQTITSIVVTSNNQGLVPDANIVQGVLTGGTLPLTITPVANQFGTVTITVTITDNGANGGANGDVNFITKTFTINVLSVNDAPSFDVVPPQTILEDAAPQSIILTNISAGPANESGQTLVLSAVSLTPNLVSTPIITGQNTVTYTPVLNANGQAIIRVTLKDNGGSLNGGVDTYTQDIVINITPVNDAPTLDAVANQPTTGQLLEDAGQQTINLTGITAGPANESAQTLTVTAAITSGNPNLVGNFIGSVVTGGTATLKYTPTPNEFGTATVTVTIADSGTNGGANGDINFTTRTFTITITPVNDAPTITAIPNQIVDEDSGLQTIGLTGMSVGPANEAPPQTVSFTLVSDNPALIPNDAGHLSIVYNQGDPTGQLLYTSVPNGFGVANITLTMKDTGGTANGGNDTVVRTFKITVNQVGDAPSALNLSNSNVFENLPSGTQVGTLSTTDVDLPDDNFTYTIVGGTGQGVFQIAGNQLQTAQSLDFESIPNYTLTIRTTDRFNLHLDQTFTINVKDVNDAPTLAPISPVIFNEDPANPVVINLTGISAGAGELQNLIITATSDNPNLFNSPLPVSYVAGSSTATLSLVPKLNANGTATVTVTIQDGGGTANGGIDTITRTFLVTVNPVNDNPTDINLSNNTIPEIVAGTQLPAHVLVGQLSSVDPDNPAAGDTFMYSLVTGAGSSDNGKFSIVNNQLFAEQSIDFDTQPDYTIRIRTTDSGTPGLFFDKIFTIHSTNVNEPASGIGTAPNAISGIPNSIPENQPVGSVVGTLVAADPDAGDSSTFSLVSGTGSQDNALFSIVNGQLIANATFNFESPNNVFHVRIQAVDSHGLTFVQSVTINVTNVDESPTGLSLSNNTVPEDISIGSAVGTLSTSDVDSPESFTYTLVAGTGSGDNARFSISGNQLIVASGLNFEERPTHTYSVRVRSTDIGGLTIEKVLTVIVTDVNEAPTDLTLSPTNIDENLPVGSVIGTLNPVDPDQNDPYTFAFVNGVGSNDNASFEFNGNKLVSAMPFDFETKSSYTIRVQATDSAGHSIERQFTITINDKKDPPVVTLAGTTLTTSGHKAIVVDPSATITDIDSPNFNGGKLVVYLQAGEQTGDTLAIKNEPRVKGGLTLKTAHGKTVLLLGKQQIGTISGGVRGIPLTIQFGSGITQDIFQRVIREVTFKGKPFAASRQVAIQAFDETGLGSNIAIRTINVN
jgi:hypothetical protein